MSDKSEQAQEPSQDRPSSDDERRGGYLGFVAHEVRNPLSTALWSAELLARMAAEERGGARGEKLTAMCLRSLGRVRQLVEDHFLCERLDVGGLPTRAEVVPVRDALDELVAKRAPDAAAVELDVGRSLATQADRSLLERLLDALVAAAGREGSQVRVSGRTEGDRVLLAFTGSAAAGPDALADPRKGSPSDPKGRALALPLARRIAAVLGGGLTVEAGAFTLTLPWAAAYTARADPAPRP